MTKHVSEGGGHQVTSDIWQCNYMVTSRDNTGTRVASDIVYIETTSAEQDINRKELYYCCSADGSGCHNSFHRQIENCCYQKKTHSWGYHQIENKHRRGVPQIPSVSLNPNNPVLINSTIKFVCLNDRQDVEIRMLCGYWIVWEQDQVAGPDSIAILFVLSILCALRLRRILSIV